MNNQKHEDNNTKGISFGEEALFDPLASIYDEWFEKEGQIIFAIEVKAFREILSSLPKPWIEIGVGSGRFAQALGIEAGLDPSVNLLELAKKRGIDAFLAKGEQQPFDKGSFKTAFLIVTFCFVNSPIEVLKETYRILSPDGKIVLGLVLRDTTWGKYYERKKQEGHRFYKYAEFYSYDEVTELLGQAGFFVEKATSTLFQPPGKVEQVELPRRGLHHDAGFVIITAGKNKIIANLKEID
jgi:ubiquinone/menaquinone biosynthesis C-methylase UbiE